jgi:hypothetical protein
MKERWWSEQISGGDRFEKQIAGRESDKRREQRLGEDVRVDDPNYIADVSCLFCGGGG